MPPVRSLPVIQSWDCHGCSDCCRTYHVRVSDAERKRIEGQGWDTDPALAGVAPTVWDAALGSHRLSHTADGACVFLGPDNRCRIHAKFGPEAKPAACRIYPFTLAPAGDHWRAGVRFACPSAAENRGRPLPEHATDLSEYAGLLEADGGGRGADLPPPPLRPGNAVPWADLLRFADAVDDLLADPRVPVELRVRRALTFAELCRPLSAAAFGDRVRETLKVLSAAAIDATPADPQAVPPPGWVGRMLFRQQAAVYARKDNGPDAGDGRRGPVTRFRAAWRFAVGGGRVPRLHAGIPEAATFAAAEHPAGPLGPDATRLLTRYYRVKVQSLQFCGRTNFDQPFWDGLAGLLLTFPVTLWLARVLSAGGGSRDAQVSAALRMTDDHFGFNPRLAAGQPLWAVRTLAERGELARLVAWYGR